MALRLGLGFSRAASAAAGGPAVIPSLVASRTTGTAPLAVHFDATATISTSVGDSFRQITYTFGYGDSGSGTWATDGLSKNSDVGGPLGAHVFETAGTYTVTVTADDGTTSASTTVTVTVSNPDTVYSGTNTICIDPTGGTTGGPAGCQYVTSMPTIISNRRYLIRRGQTISGFTVPSTVTGVRIGAYGTGAKPIVTGQININNGSTPTVAQWAEDVAIFDLAGDSGAEINQCGRNLMLLRCDFANTDIAATNAINCDNTSFFAQVQYNTVTDTWGSGDTNRVLARSDFYVPKYIFVVECYQRGNSSSTEALNAGLYASVDCAAFMGNDFKDSCQHIHRFYLARKTLIQHSVLQHTTNTPGNHAIKLHSGGTNAPQANVQNQADGLAWYSEQVVIRRNTLGDAASTNTQTVAIRPQNNGAIDTPLGQEGIQDVIVENNTFIDSTSTVTDISAGPARRVTTRNNTLPNGIGQDTSTYPEPIQTYWRGPYYGQFTAAQTLSPSLFTNSSTFYSPTVTTTGVQVIQASRLSSTFGASPRSVSISAVGSGSTVVVLVGVATVNQGAGVSVTDNQGNTYTQDLSFTNTNSDGTRYFFRASNVTNAPTSISCTFGSGSALITFDIFEISGLANVSPVDATVADTTSTANSTPSKSITTTTNNCFVVSYLDLADGRTFTPAAGWTALPSSGSNFGFTVYDDNVGAAGSKTVSGTLSSSVNWRFGVVAYKPA